MKSHRLGAAARDELSQAARFYENRRENLGHEFLDEFVEAVERIEADPASFPVVKGDHRSCILRRFPYQIIFVNSESEIWIAAIAHHKRRDQYWTRRKPD
jgi:hypothetical protein